ncbi:hypothetical protein PRIPAC_71640, partial [Pristionchus pacificus]
DHVFNLMSCNSKNVGYTMQTRSNGDYLGLSIHLWARRMQVQIRTREEQCKRVYLNIRMSHQHGVWRKGRVQCLFQWMRRNVQ